MTIEIALKNSYGRLSNREPFLIATDTPVVLAFHSDYLLSTAIVRFENGAAKSSVRVSNLAEIAVPESCKKAGELKVSVSLLVRERVAKTWTVEPIMLVEDSTGFSLHPEFEDIRARLAALETVANNHTLALSELQAIVSAMNETVSGIDEIVNDPLE